MLVTIRTVVLLLAIAAVSACSILPEPQRGSRTTHLLEPGDGVAVTAADGPTLTVSRLRSAPGYDTPAMLYSRRTGVLERYANHRWVDVPARMIQPMLVRSAGNSGVYSAVVAAPSPTRTDLRLDVTVVRLRQLIEADAGRVQVTLRAELSDGAGKVLLARDFGTSVTAAADPESGAAATQRAVEGVIADMMDAIREHLNP